MNVIYIVNDHREAEWLSQDLGVDIGDCIPVDSVGSSLLGRRIRGIRSTVSARRHVRFGAALQRAEACLAKSEPKAHVDIESYGIRSHPLRDAEPLPPYLYN